MTTNGVYIRISGSTKAPHWLPHVVPNKLLLQDISDQTYVNGVVSSLHRNKKETRRVFGLRFLCRQKFVKLKISNKPRMRLVFWPPSNSKRFLFKDMIPKGISKNLCIRLVLFGAMLMKIYCLGNEVNNRCL